MKLHTLLIIGLALGLAGCAKKDQETAPQASDAETTAAAESAVEAVEEVTAEGEEMGTAGFASHMHHHASQLERLNDALAAGSLVAAQRSAYWLSGHDAVSGVPEDWQVYIVGMRDAATAVAEAPDLAAANAAAQRIVENCNGCHTAAGIEVVTLQPE